MQVFPPLAPIAHASRPGAGAACLFRRPDLLWGIHHDRLLALALALARSLSLSLSLSLSDEEEEEEEEFPRSFTHSFLHTMLFCAAHRHHQQKEHTHAQLAFCPPYESSPWKQRGAE